MPKKSTANGKGGQAGGQPSGAPKELVHSTTLPRAKPPPTSRRTALLDDGEVVGNRYEIRRLIASGGMGEVYEAFDSALSQSCALKLVRAEVADDPMLVERFKDEVRLGMKVTHPNVCRVFEFGVHAVEMDRGLQQLPFMTMELLSGETLAHRIKQKTLSEEEALKLLPELGEGLLHAHQRGVIHRDFKPLNVILCTDSSGKVRPVITDFGLALLQGGARRSRAGQFFGTAEYLAPEQLSGGEISPATDVYALGVTLFEMVTGATPFNEPTAIATAMKRLYEPPPSPRVHGAVISDRFEALLFRCMALKPEERFPGVREMLDYISRKTPGGHTRANRVSTADSVYLVGTHGLEKGRVFIAKSGDVIGRSEDADVHLSDDTVSRKHARVEVSGGRWRIIDTNSSNGIGLFGEEESEAVAISSNTEFRIGNAIFCAVIGDELTLRSKLPTTCHRAREFDGVVPLAMAPTQFMKRLEDERARARAFRRNLSVAMLRVMLSGKREPRTAESYPADRDVGLMLCSRLEPFQTAGRLRDGELFLILPEEDTVSAAKTVEALTRGFPTSVTLGKQTFKLDLPWKVFDSEDRALGDVLATTAMSAIVTEVGPLNPTIGPPSATSNNLPALTLDEDGRVIPKRRKV